ncbi:MAG TPA: non-homologous end-joining DNA ligase [Patescibacteria group bacterium]|jgi:bifunctional non-homologous end joining protein LigD|nr:non-homologous end-joining DNA ligase [Patescibacteria group bacterium]
MSKTLHIGAHDIEITHEEKELFPRQHITKQDIVEYYQAVAPLMLPYVKNRPIAMQRFPLGIDHEGFFQKNAAEYFPEWIKTKRVIGKNGKLVHYILINNAETLVYLVNQYCITPHIWLSTIDNINQPDRMIFDLDPSGHAKFQLIKWVAKKLRTLLQEEGLESYVMSTGSRGLHLIIPLKPRHPFEEVRAYAKNIAEKMLAEHTKYVTLEPRVADRGNKIYIDVLRNSFAQTTVAPYAVRGLPGAPIAVPLSWSELERITPQKYTIQNIYRRLAKVGTVWDSLPDQTLKLRKNH